MNIELKIATFINRALTKNREIGKQLIAEFDREDYQSPVSRELLLKISKTQDVLDLLNTEARGGLPEKEIANMIDFFYWWLQLYKVVAVNYTNYRTAIEGSSIIIDAGDYATKDELNEEISDREDGDEDLQDQLDDLTGKKVDKVAHGFAVKDVLTIDAAGLLIKVSDPGHEKRIGIVVEVINANSFRMVMHGHVKGLSGLVAGSVYYAQEDGSISTTVTGMIVLIADSTTSGYLIPTSVVDEHQEDEVDTTGATINLDMKNSKKRSFFGSASINSPKTWAILNDAIGRYIESGRFTIAGEYAQTLPASVQMSDPRFLNGVWTPGLGEAGEFELSGKKVGNTWRLQIIGPFV